jgi:hypothetical protein
LVTILAGLALSLTSATVTAAATFTAVLDRDTVYEGESVEVVVTARNARSESAPIPPTVANLTIQQAGVTRSRTIFNGVQSSSLEYRFAVESPPAGEYTIPPFRAELDGVTMSTQPLRLRVLPGQNPAISQVALLQLRTDKQRVFVGEVLPVEIGVALRTGGYNEAPQLQQEGLTMGQMEQLPRRLKRIGGMDYEVDPFRTYVIAARSGSLKLGPATLPFGVPVRSRLGLFGRESMVVKLRSAVIDLEVIPLPDEGVPAGFTGAVGRFTMNVQVSTNAVAAGDPILVTVEINGEGPIQSLQLESFDDWEGFKIYAPETAVELKDKLGLQGTKRFTQVVIPESPEVKALLSIQFSFFDPARQRYETLRHEAMPITVRRSSVVTAFPGMSGAADESGDTVEASREIVHIKSRLGQYGLIQPPLILSPWFPVLSAVPLLAWLGISVWQWQNARVARDPRLRRRQQVARLVREGMTQLRQAAAQNDTETFFATVFRLLQERLGELTGRPASAIDELSLDSDLEGKLGGEVLAEVRGLFQSCGVARYAPGRLNAELHAYLPRVESVLERLRSPR